MPRIPPRSTRWSGASSIARARSIAPACAKAAGSQLKRSTARSRACSHRAESKPATATARPYTSRELFIPIDAAAGWEAAVYDHFHALVRTICSKLALAPSDPAHELTGGSTYSFAIGRGHPLQAEVEGTLKRLRAELSALRARVDSWNAEHGAPADPHTIVTYVGQHAVDGNEADEGESPS